MKRFFSFFIPGGVLFFASIFIVHMDRISSSLPAILAVYPYLVFFCAILIGWRFNRSSLVFAAVVLAIADRSLLYCCSSYSGGSLVAMGVFHAVSFLLPVNLAILCLVKERGIFTIHGIIRIVLIVIQPCLIAVFLKGNPEGLVSLLTHEIFDWGVFSGSFLPKASLCAGGGT